MNHQIKSSRINMVKHSIGFLLLASIVLSACQAPAAQPLVQNTAPPTIVPTKMPIATGTPTSEPTPAVLGIPQTGQSNTPATAGEANLNVFDHPKLGKILVDGNGMTLYMYTKDGPDQSNCSGACLDAWPPMLTKGDPTLGEGIDASLVGTAMLADGTMIVTYNKMPLYTWYKDTKPGDATGQGNKDVWYVVASDGKAVGIPGASTNSDYSYDEGDYSYNK